MNSAKKKHEHDEMVDYIWEAIPEAVNYWVRNATQNTDTLQIFETIDSPEGTPPISLSKSKFAYGITSWCEGHAKGHQRKDFDQFAKDWLWGDYELIAYFDDTVDQMVQWSIFGQINYG